MAYYMISNDLDLWLYPKDFYVYDNTSTGIFFSWYG